MENTPIANEVVVPKMNILFKVTTVSKVLAAVLFIILPFVGFWIGTKYSEDVNSDIQTPTAPTTYNHTRTPQDTITPENNDSTLKGVNKTGDVQIKNIVITSQNEESFSYPYLITYEVTGVVAGTEVIGNLVSFTNPEGTNDSLETAASTSVRFTHPLDTLGNYKLTVTSFDGAVLDTAVLCMKPNNICRAEEDEVSEYTGPLFDLN